ncbi:MAG TPA: diaminopimelate decarboxylase [Nocardioidaceae bacterium]|nr:diaminopimelate decarboxylase [Nocardioidaceae bacterium]
MRAHEAGALHAEATSARGPAWLMPPHDLNALTPELWSRNVARDESGVLSVSGVGADTLAARFGTPVYVVDEDDFRARAREFRRAFHGFDVYYAGKAFLCLATVRWIDEEGLDLDVCSGGELAVALRAGFDPARIGFHGNNKSVPELISAVEAGVGRIIVDSHAEVDRLSAIAAQRGTRQAVLVRVTAGVEAHTHAYIATAHEDQKFGFSIAGGDALDAMRLVEASGSLDLVGLHSHIGSQIFETAGFEVAARRVLALYSTGLELGMNLRELNLGGGFGIAYTTQDDPASPAQLAGEITAIVAAECRTLGIGVPQLSIEPGRAIAGPSTFTLYEVGTAKAVALDAGASRLYVSVDGGMSDNIRPALYDADFSCALASRRSTAGPMLARVVGKHCESGDIVVKDEFLPLDVDAGDLIAVPATGAYCRALASTYNHVPRPPVVAVRQGRARVIVRRETEDDLLRLEVE